MTSKLKGEAKLIQSTPMPKFPIMDAPVIANRQGLMGEATNVISMDDYPSGRGGMQMVPMASDARFVRSVIRPISLIGPKPLTTNMPSITSGVTLSAQSAEALENSQKSFSAVTKVIAMNDYPDGRGGMRLVPIASSARLVQPVFHPISPIGSKPLASKMPVEQ